MRSQYGRFSRRRGIVLVFFVTMALAGFILPDESFAQKYPAKAVKLLCPYAPGGPVDVTGRSLAEIAGKLLGQPVVMENAAGAGGVRAQSILAKEKPDGYTLSITSNIAFVQIPQMREVPFDPLKDFEYIVQHMVMTGGIVCRKDAPWKTIDDLIAYSKKNPGKVTYASPGVGGASHVGAEMIAEKEGVKWRMVPYKGSVEVTTALLGGHVDLAICDMIPWTEHVKSGALRILAIEKTPVFPEATTFDQRGYNTTVGATFGIVAPKGTPKEILITLETAFKAAVKDPAYVKGCDKLGLSAAYASGDEFFEEIKKEYKVRGPVLERLGLKKK